MIHPIRSLRIATPLLLAAAALHAAAPVAELRAVHREGQTFLTWKESGADLYRVYRHTAKITPENRAQAKMIAEIKKGSSRWEEMFQSKDRSQLVKNDKLAEVPWIIPRLVIEPVGDDNKPKMIPGDVGVLVWTVTEDKRDSYYAVTAVTGGDEDRAIGGGNSAGPVAEKREPIGATLYYVQSFPTDRAFKAQKRIAKAKAEQKEPDSQDVQRAKECSPFDWYIMYMPYHEWNADYLGYAFPFHLNRNAFEEYAKTKIVPSAHLDGIGTMNVFAAGYANYGTGDFAENGSPTWYFGYGTRVHDRQGGMDVKQEIRNFTQYRIMQSVLFARRKYKIETPQFHMNGNSMGASGVIGFAMAFPDAITSIWANQGQTDYANTTLWQGSMWGNYGKPELGNSVKLIPFGDARLDWVLKNDGMNVFDFRNAAKFLAKNVDKSFPLLCIGHTHGDGSITPASQAYPFENYIKHSRHTFCYTVKDGLHGWKQAYNGSPMIPHVYFDQSRPGFSGCPPVPVWLSGKMLENSRGYAPKLAWASRSKKIKEKELEETEELWSMPLLLEAKEGEEKSYFLDITPRNLQKFNVAAGAAFTYRILGVDGNPRTIHDFASYVNGADARDKFRNAGDIVADANNLLLVPWVPIDREGCIVEVKRRAQDKRP